MNRRQDGFTTADLGITIAAGIAISAIATVLAFAIINRDSSVSFKVAYIAGKAIEYEDGYRANAAGASPLRPAEYAAQDCDNDSTTPALCTEEISGSGGTAVFGRACRRGSGCVFHDADVPSGSAAASLSADVDRTGAGLPWHCDTLNSAAGIDGSEAVYGVWVNADDETQAQDIQDRLETAARTSGFEILAYGRDAAGVLACF